MKLKYRYEEKDAIEMNDEIAASERQVGLLFYKLKNNALY